MAAAQVSEFRVYFAAYIHNTRAAGTEVAAFGWISRAGHVTLQNNALALGFNHRIWNRNGRQQRLGIGMPGVIVDRLPVRNLDDRYVQCRNRLVAYNKGRIQRQRAQCRCAAVDRRRIDEGICPDDRSRGMPAMDAHLTDMGIHTFASEQPVGILHVDRIAQALLFLIRVSARLRSLMSRRYSVSRASSAGGQYRHM